MFLELVLSGFCNCSHMLHELLWNQVVRWIPDYLKHTHTHTKNYILKMWKPIFIVQLPSHTTPQPQPTVPAGGRPRGYISRRKNGQPCWWTFSRSSAMLHVPCRGGTKKQHPDGLVRRFPWKRWGYFHGFVQTKHLRLWYKWYLLNR